MWTLKNVLTKLYQKVLEESASELLLSHIYVINREIPEIACSFQMKFLKDNCRDKAYL